MAKGNTHGGAFIGVSGNFVAELAAQRPKRESS